MRTQEERRAYQKQRYIDNPWYSAGRYWKKKKVSEGKLYEFKDGKLYIDWLIFITYNAFSLLRNSIKVYSWERNVSDIKLPNYYTVKKWNIVIQSK